MTLFEKCECLIKRGFVYNPETGIITNPYGKEITSKNADGYVVLNASRNGKQYKFYAHQFAWFYIHKETVKCLDHINQVKNDNRIENLRSVTRLQNQHNHKEKRGYTENKRDGTWTAQINFKGKHWFLGNFKTEIEAREIYLKAKNELLENFDRLNESEFFKPKEYKGYTKVKNKNLFEVSLMVKGKRFRSFHKTEIEAKEAYLNKKKEMTIKIFNNN